MKVTARSARGYDLYGNIVVIDAVPNTAKALAEKLLLENKNIETVLRKGGAVKGLYRTRRFVYVAGRRNYLATYRENGCVFRFDIRKTFFSTRLAYERKRVSEMAKDGEHVVVMFSGVGPYAIEIAKTHKKSAVVAIELNSAACRYARENARLNKTPNVVLEQGNVDAFAKKYSRFADRIVMPLPKGSSKFLESAFEMCSRGCVIHYYTFCKEGEQRSAMRRLTGFFSRKGRKARVLGHRMVRPYSATEIELVVDLLVN